MKTNKDLIEIASLKLVTEGVSMDRTVKGVYCCDLLSIAMSKATSDFAWITVMANVNTLAVATLVDISCIVIAEGMSIDETTVEKAIDKGITIFSSELPIYECARTIDKFINSVD